ncbi:hypothetical protein KBTX_00657 [wastewater metagenome]|uniref:Uncharacterized protein n=2 Tax=unclassified sequences TaxID=12908 RepID=A0A5B8R611_9ZZZZ|nr:MULTISPECIES: hypothetical protein [Arhodomonas]QEA04349.1 hypothetical protein KBTEX_00657 [uncultured organism]
MAIKSWDPRKLQDHDIQGSRFEHLVADAWAEVHEDDGLPGQSAEASYTETASASENGSDWHATHTPFANLRDQLTRH